MELTRSQISRWFGMLANMPWFTQMHEDGYTFHLADNDTLAVHTVDSKGNSLNRMIGKYDLDFNVNDYQSASPEYDQIDLFSGVMS